MLVPIVRVRPLRQEISKRRLVKLKSENHMGIIKHINKPLAFSDMLGGGIT